MKRQQKVSAVKIEIVNAIPTGAEHAIIIDALESTIKDFRAISGIQDAAPLPPQADAVATVVELKQAHCKTWRDKPESYWFTSLSEEIGELASALMGEHEHTPEYELKQIAAICLNWLELRAALATLRQEGEGG